MTTHRKFIWTIALMMTGCASAAPLTTPSGKPEVLLRGKTQAEAIDMIITNCITNNLIVESQTSNMVTCSKVTGAGIQTLLGSGQYKYQYIVSKHDDGIRVMMPGVWIEGMNGFGGMTRHAFDMNKGKAAQQLQADLMKMAGEKNGQNR